MSDIKQPEDITFIIGVPRSGTTLVRVILDSHSEIAAGPETGWLTGGYTDKSLRQLVELLTDDRLGLVDNYEGVSKGAVFSAAGSFVKDLMTKHLQSVSKPRLILKTPNDIAYLDFLAELFPDARFIHVFRDGRDVACSTMAKKGEYFSDDTLGDFGGLTFLNALERWRVWESNARAIEEKKGLSVLRLNYESLVREPEAELRRLCEFIGVQFEPSMLQYASFEHRYPAWEAGSKDVSEKDSIQESSIGKWKKSISLLDASGIPPQTDEYLVELGYESTQSLFDADFLSQTRIETELHKTSMDKLHEEVNRLHAELKEKETLVLEPLKKFDEVQGSLSQLENRYSDLLAQVQRIAVDRAEVQTLGRENLELRRSVSETERQLADLQRERDGLLKESEQTNARMMERMAQLERELEDTLQRLSDEKSETATRIVSLETEKREIEKAKKRAESLNRQSQMIQDSLKSVIGQQEIGLREKEEVIQNILNSRTWKVARSVVVPLAFFRNVRRGKVKIDKPEVESDSFTGGISDADKRKDTANVDATDATISTASLTKGGEVNLGNQIQEYFGAHRSGWSYAVQNLERLHNPKAIYLDTFIERTFAWPGHREPILRPWLGVVHVPPTGPEWFLGEQSNEAVFSSDLWKASEPYCRGLYCLSNYHKRELEKRLALPIDHLIHPTETPEVLWDPERFRKSQNRKVIQLGWWLRVLHSIYELPPTGYEKVFLRARADQAFQDSLAQERKLHLEAGLFDPSMEESVTHVDFLENSEYDRLLTENVAFIHLYDASANNAVIECIVRNTPLLVNPIPPVIEYLGSGYPLYFSSLEEASSKLSNTSLILQAHEYLKNHPIKEKLSGQYFAMSIETSRLTNSL